MRYKIIYVKDCLVWIGSGEITTSSYLREYVLEKQINEWADQGWILDQITFGKSVKLGEDTFILIFKQE